MKSLKYIAILCALANVTASLHADPQNFDTFDDFWTRLETLFTRPFARTPLHHIGKYTTNNVEVAEDPTAKIIKIKAALPGYKKENIKVVIDETTRIISISATKTEEKEAKKHNNDTTGLVYYEYSSYSSARSFNRNFKLPKRADLDAIATKFKNGELTISIPLKEQEEQNEVRALTIEGEE